MTLTEFLQFPFTKDFKLLNHIANTDSILIDYVSILEAPAENFVRSRELILSASYSIKDDCDALLNFIQTVYESDAAGIVFSFPGNTYEQLDPLLALFSQRNFPILSMDYDHLFQDVVESTLREIWKKDMQIQTNLEAMQRSLLSYSIHGNTMDDAAELISAFLKSDIIILDMNHHILGRNKRIRSLSAKNLLDTRTSEILRIEISAHGHVYGYLILEDTAAASYLHTSSFVQYLTTPMTLWFDKEYAIMTSKMKEKESFVWKLAHHEYSSSQDAYSKADYLSFNTAVPYACLVADISHCNASETIIEEQVIQISGDFHLSVMTTLRHQQLIIFLEAANGCLPQQTVENYITAYEQNIKNIIPSICFLWGYDLQGFSVDALYNNYQNAKIALSVCQSSGGRITRSCFQLSLLDKVKSLLRDNPEISLLAENTLKRILDYDAEKNTEYLKTLEAYLFHNYNITAAAKALNIHRQTMIYRLEKLEELSSFSLSSHEDLFLMELCLRIVMEGKQQN